MELTPALVLSMWAAGLAAGGGLVAWWQLVGPGYVWLASATVVLFGAFAAVAGGGLVAWSGVVVAVFAATRSRNRSVAVAAFGAATALFAGAALPDSPVVPILTGAIFMGGITSEMTLGHWYLIDPTLPRWALQRLTVAGGVGLIAEVIFFATEGVFGFGDDAVLAWSYVALAGMTGLLVVGVWFSLKEPGYTGVMAATGLSYLGTLTAIGALVVSRLVVWGA